jgi:hypothetical protein
MKNSPCKCFFQSNRTNRYLNRTIKKEFNESINDKKHIKFLSKHLKYMTDYSFASYDYNNFLLNIINETKTYSSN